MSYHHRHDTNITNRIDKGWCEVDNTMTGVIDTELNYRNAFNPIQVAVFAYST
jgi:hypothetical protein